MRLCIKRALMSPVMFVIAVLSMPVIPICAMFGGREAYDDARWGFWKNVWMHLLFFVVGCVFAPFLPFLAVWWCWTEME